MLGDAREDRGAPRRTVVVDGRSSSSVTLDRRAAAGSRRPTTTTTTTTIAAAAARREQETVGCAARRQHARRDGGSSRWKSAGCREYYALAMALLESRIERTGDFDRRSERMRALVDELRERSAEVARRRRRAGGRAAPVAREAARRGSGSTACRSGDGVPRAERARRVGRVRRRGAERRDRHRDRRRRGPRVRRRRERRDREGRLVLPADGQEAPARAGGRRAEPAAVHLPRRLGRCVPAAAGRGLPGPRPLRPDLLQPGADVGEGHSADRRRDGLVHRRRRVRPGDERRDGDRAPAPGRSSSAARRS